MGKLIYAITTSLDGFVADANGRFDWAEPSEEVHQFFNDLVRNSSTSLLGRKMYEIMKVWDEIPTEGVSGPYMDGPSPAMNDYARIWQNTDKIVYSRTLREVTTARTTVQAEFDAEQIRQMVANSEVDFDIGGPLLTAEAIRAGIVDEFHQILALVVVGAGNHWLPSDVRLDLELISERSFQNGFVHLHYRTKS